MIVSCNRIGAVAAGVLLATLLATACGSSDLVVGDDSTDTTDGPGADTNALPETSTPDSSSDAAQDATADTKTDVTCPELNQPLSGFCDGGSFVPTYNSNGCTSGFACAPVPCTAAGGSCVALVPGACASGHTGDATKYSCGGGVGVECCLP